MIDHLFNTRKLAYVRGPKPEGCILCAIRDRDPAVESLEVTRTAHFMVSVNLFPFNPGHLLVFPLRHVTAYGELSDEEALDLHRLTARTLAILEEEFSPAGFNLGYNLGRHSGASIAHLHLQIVPRYENEFGYLEVLAGAKLIVADPRETLERLRKRFV